MFPQQVNIAARLNLIAGLRTTTKKEVEQKVNLKGMFFIHAYMQETFELLLWGGKINKKKWEIYRIKLLIFSRKWIKKLRLRNLITHRSNRNKNWIFVCATRQSTFFLLAITRTLLNCGWLAAALSHFKNIYEWVWSKEKILISSWYWERCRRHCADVIEKMIFWGENNLLCEVISVEN